MGRPPVPEVSRWKLKDGGDGVRPGPDREIAGGLLETKGAMELGPLPAEGLAVELLGPITLGLEITPPAPLLRENVLGEGVLTEGAERMMVEGGEDERPENEGLIDRLGADIRGEEAEMEPEERLMDRGAAAALRLIWGAGPLVDPGAAIESAVKVANRTTVPRHVRGRVAGNMVGILLRVGQAILITRRKPPSQLSCYEKHAPATRKGKDCRPVAREDPR